MIWEVWVSLFVVVLSAGLGYGLGRQHGREDAEAQFERMRRIDPPNRTAGAPTNLDGPTAHLRRTRWMQGMLRGERPPER